MSSYKSNSIDARRESKGGADRRRVAIISIKSDLALVAPPDVASANLTRLTPPPSPVQSRWSPSSSTPMLSPVTPDIGQPKDIHVPVAGPVILNIHSHSRKPHTPPPDPSFPATPTSSTASSFLHYQPGVHSLAGPLPPPPRANFNINIHNPPPPRPPRFNSPAPTRSKRDLDAVKQSLQLPPSVTAILASKSSSLEDIKPSTKSDIKPSTNSDIQPSSKSDIQPSTKSDIQPSTKSDIQPSSEHPREGALSPVDIVNITPATNTENKDTTDVTPAEIDHHKFSQWLKSNPDLLQPLGTRRRGSSVDETHFPKQTLPDSPERSDSSGGSDAPSPPPKSLRNSLMNIKRLSLSRTASLSSRSARRWSAGNTYHSSRTPSPSIHHFSLPQVPKITSANPAALFCHEVHTQRTTSERCLIYATKINELHLYDCGLSEWVVNMKSRGPNSQHQKVPSSSAQPFTPKPRHTSRSSVISEATFPRRPDASAATDLSQSAYGEISPTSVSLTLPYPSLAMNPPRSNPSRSNSSIGPSPSIRSLAPSTSISLKSGGFFTSLGRKSSLSKKEKTNNLLIPPASDSLPSPLKGGRLLSISSKHVSSQSLTTMNISRPYISTPPSVPGGPRAPSHRVQRSHTYTPSFPPRSTNSDIGRRPSMFDLSLDTVIDIHPEPEFIEQVDKLARLLPHANRDVLAGYLRRAGKDMLAIGQYLEDEKNGSIQLYD